MALAELDQKILEWLLKDARLSFRQIGKRLRVSAATVAQHVERLEKQGVIEGYSVRLDYERLGYHFPVLIEVKVAHGKLFEVEGKLAQDPHVYMVIDHTGGTDATVMARFRDREGLDRFVKRIQSIPHVERTETKLVLNVIKQANPVLEGTQAGKKK
jgi:DNA-binding Lrp family transcriptional regulator